MRGIRFASVFALVVLGICVTAEAGKQKQLPWLGLSVRPFQAAAGDRMLHVERVASGGPSETAGVMPGDIITRMRGEKLQFVDDLDFLLFLSERKPGERLLLQIVRSGEPKLLRVTVGTMPSTARPAWERALDTARRKRIAAQQRSH